MIPSGPKPSCGETLWDDGLIRGETDHVSWTRSPDGTYTNIVHKTAISRAAVQKVLEGQK